MENAIFDIDSDKIVTDWITAQKEFDLPVSPKKKMHVYTCI